MDAPETSMSQNERRLPSWLTARVDAYVRTIAALCLGIPVLFLVLVWNITSFRIASLAGLYASLVFLGYYVLVLLVLATCVFAVLAISKRLAVAACALLFALALFYLTVDATVYRLYRFHADAFSLEYVITTFGGMGVSAGTLALAVGLLAGVGGIVWLLFRVAARMRFQRRFIAVVITTALLAFVASQAMHIVAYQKNDTRVTNVTPELPFYYPIKDQDEAVKYGGLLPMIAENAHASGADESLALSYPHNLPASACVAKRRPNVLLLLLESWRFDTMNETVSPHMYAFSKRSSVFLQHFSSGNATPTGVFSLFYGIHPTYWTAVKANSAAIDNPVLIDVLKANGYSFGIFADSHFSSEKIKDTTFRDIDVHEAFKGATPDARDRDMDEQLLAFAARAHAAKTPFFAFAFYKSTHASYYYPKTATRFTPAHKLNVAFAGTQDRTLYLNDYKNAVSYVDDLVGDVISRLETSGILDSTIVVITSDHGEEFNDNNADYWGHASNFTGFQTRVPMIIYVPWEKPRQVDTLTMHVDIPPTILEEGLGCARDEATYTNGHNLWGPLSPTRPVVIGSYVNYAVIIGDDVSSVFPMYVQKYKLWDVRAKAGTPSVDLVRKAMDEMNQFYRRGNVTG